VAIKTLNIDAETLSASLQSVHKSWRDTNHTSTPFLTAHDEVHGKGKPNKPGGPRWLYPIGIGNHSVTTEVISGYEEINLEVEGILEPAVFTPAHALRPVVISGEEEEMNGLGELQIIDIAKARLEKVLAALRRELEQQVWKGGQVGWSRWETLNGLDTGTGFLEENASSGQTNVIGGVSRVTHAGVHGLTNIRYDFNNTFNSTGLTGLNRMKLEMMAYSDGVDEKLRGFASISGMENYKRSLQAYERYVDKKELDAGNLALGHAGTSIVPNLYMPDDGATTTGTPVSFVFLNFAGVYLCWSKAKYDGFFGMSQWGPVAGNYDILHCKCRVRGQLVMDGKMDNSAVGVKGEQY